MLFDLRAVFAGLLGAVSVLAGCNHISQSLPISLPQARSSERAMWVTRFDYKTREDVVRIVESSRTAGINTILFQVRGNATVMYPSSIEPWAEQFNFADPGFDPLAVAIEAAHERDMRLVAWVNVVPAWWGTTPPAFEGQIYNKRPEWMWYDQHGKRQALSEKFYVSLNPCLPEVRKYLVQVMRDLVGRYSVDGLHLDYLRFPNEPPATPAGSKIDYPRDAATLALFRGETGNTPEQDPKGWNAWRTEQVSNLLRDIRRIVRQTRPTVELSAAVGPDPDKALEHFQDVRTWLADDLLDAVYPMNYTQDVQRFRERAEYWKELADGHKVVLGVRLESNDPEILRQELEIARTMFRGYSLFAYSSIFDSPNTAIDAQDEAAREQRQARRKALLPVLKEAAFPGASSGA